MQGNLPVQQAQSVRAAQLSGALAQFRLNTRNEGPYSRVQESHSEEHAEEGTL